VSRLTTTHRQLVRPFERAYKWAESPTTLGVVHVIRKVVTGKKKKFPPRPPRQKKSKLALFVCVSCVWVASLSCLSLNLAYLNEPEQLV
jgi:hypothetical protein